MARHALLNNVSHKDMRVITRHCVAFGDSVSSVVIFPTEYADAQRDYPILFRKDADTGELLSVALLGFEKDENLFLDEAGWHANYIPAVVSRGPFLIGFQEQEMNGIISKNPVIHVDLDNPRISTTEGETVFSEHGGNTPYIDRIASILQGLQQGVEVSKVMFAAFTELNLIEPVNVQIKISNDELHNLLGYYTIHEERLATLDAESLYKLNQAGFLRAAFLVMASLGNVKKLIDMKHRRRQVAVPA